MTFNKAVQHCYFPVKQRPVKELWNMCFCEYRRVQIMEEKKIGKIKNKRA